MGDYTRPLGPFGIDPLAFSATLFGLLFLFVLYLLLPRAFRVEYFGGYPKRYAWSARSRGGSRRKKPSMGGEYPGYGGGSSVSSATRPRMGPSGGGYGSRPRDASLGGTPGNLRSNDSSARGGPHGGTDPDGTSRDLPRTQPPSHSQTHSASDDIVVSAAMQQLRDPGVLIVAHGSRGKPKTVRLVLTETAITWRTEMRKKNSANPSAAKELKLGKLHQVPLSHIMYVDVGKQTAALRRVENAAVAESLCFSLLTKEGSLDLEANSPRERDALVSCFSLVLDEVHAKNWRDIYRGPSSDMPSSFDDGDVAMGMGPDGV
mmetsp:Transcript_4784/g.10284  ORF Transcript_4784/g.10284 Transcript_4784/m.10284 type:complete len:318 (-) Transcript_4784:198-1151(-)